MKKILPILACFSLVALTSVAAGWPQQQVTRTVSLSFPAAPQVSRNGAQTSYVSVSDTTSYQAVTMGYVNDGKVQDSLTLISWYEGMPDGILRAAHGTLVRKEIIHAANLHELEIEYVRGDKNSLPVTICSRALLLNGELLVYSFTAPSPRYDHMHKLKDQFFASLAVRTDTALAQYQPRTAGDSVATLSASSTVAAAHDSTSRPQAAPTHFFDSHAGSVLKMFGLLVLFCALIYFFATLTRRKG